MERLLSALTDCLRDAGLHVLRDDPNLTLPRLKLPMVALRVERAQRSSLAPHDLLAFHYSSGRTIGKALTLVVELVVYSPYRSGAQLCENAVSMSMAALDGGLSMANLSMLDCGPIAYDVDADCYCCHILVQLSAWDVTFVPLSE